jgi:hypothetical protein
MPDLWSPARGLATQEALDRALLLERIQAMPSEILEKWGGPGFWKMEFRDRAALSRLEMAWRRGGDTPFR